MHNAYLTSSAHPRCYDAEALTLPPAKVYWNIHRGKRLLHLRRQLPKTIIAGVTAHSLLRQN